MDFNNFFNGATDFHVTKFFLSFALHRDVLYFSLQIL